MGFLDKHDLPGKEENGRYVIRDTLTKYITLGANNKHIIIDPENKEFIYHKKLLWGLLGEHVVLRFDELSHIKHAYGKIIRREQSGRTRRVDVYRISIVSNILSDYHIHSFSNSSKARAFANTLQHYTGLDIRSPN